MNELSLHSLEMPHDTRIVHGDSTRPIWNPIGSIEPTYTRMLGSQTRPPDDVPEHETYVGGSLTFDPPADPVHRLRWTNTPRTQQFGQNPTQRL